MRISDWSSDVCSSDLPERAGRIIDRAYREVACSGEWTFAAFIRHFDRVVSEECAKSNQQPSIALDRGESAAWELRSKKLAAHHKRRLQIAMRMQAFAGIILRFLEGMLPEFIGQPLLRLGRQVARWLKPRLRRILLD